MLRNIFQYILWLLQGLYDIISVSIPGYFFITFSDEVRYNMLALKYDRTRLWCGFLMIYEIISYENVKKRSICIKTRFVEIVIIHPIKRSKKFNTQTLCSQNIHIIPTKRVRSGVNIQKNWSSDATKGPLSLFLSRILLLVRPPVQAYHLHEHSLILFSSMADDRQRF